ncbi:MAG TPA: hypothetical protein QF423_02900 [Candidatus Scalindua sp.]|nr:hypothetical protein [Candidatus Scalindua sp.]
MKPDYGSFAPEKTINGFRNTNYRKSTVKEMFFKDTPNENKFIKKTVKKFEKLQKMLNKTMGLKKPPGYSKVFSKKVDLSLIDKWRVQSKKNLLVNKEEEIVSLQRRQYKDYYIKPYC